LIAYAKVEHAFRVFKRHFGHTKVRYHEPKKNCCPALHAVCAIDLVDGAGKIDGKSVKSAPKNGTWDRNGADKEKKGNPRQAARTP
jgi:hypothetical protein